MTDSGDGHGDREEDLMLAWRRQIASAVSGFSEDGALVAAATGDFDRLVDIAIDRVRDGQTAEVMTELSAAAQALKDYADGVLGNLENGLRAP